MHPIYVPPPKPELFYAETVYERIEKLLVESAKNIKEGQSLQVEIPLSGGRIIFPCYFGYQNPNFIIVYGEDSNGNEVKAFLPHTNIEILVTIFNKPSERKPIGFQGRDAKPEI